MRYWRHLRLVHVLDNLFGDLPDTKSQTNMHALLSSDAIGILCFIYLSLPNNTYIFIDPDSGNSYLISEEPPIYGVNVWWQHHSASLVSKLICRNYLNPTYSLYSDRILVMVFSSAPKGQEIKNSLHLNPGLMLSITIRTIFDIEHSLKSALLFCKIILFGNIRLAIKILWYNLLGILVFLYNSCYNISAWFSRVSNIIGNIQCRQSTWEDNCSVLIITCGLDYSKHSSSWVFCP